VSADADGGGELNGRATTTLAFALHSPLDPAVQRCWHSVCGCCCRFDLHLFLGRPYDIYRRHRHIRADNRRPLFTHQLRENCNVNSGIISDADLARAHV
jgi:hypothetical protein